MARHRRSPTNAAVRRSCRPLASSNWRTVCSGRAPSSSANLYECSSRRPTNTQPVSTSETSARVRVVERGANRLAGDRHGPRRAARGPDEGRAFEDVLRPGVGQVAASGNDHRIARRDGGQGVAPARRSKQRPAGRRLRQDRVELLESPLTVFGTGAVVERQSRAPRSHRSAPPIVPAGPTSASTGRQRRMRPLPQ